MSGMSDHFKRFRRKLGYRLANHLFRTLDSKITGSLQIQQRELIRRYRNMVKNKEPLPPLEEVEFKIFSQNGEDGILLFLIAVAGSSSRCFLEIGIQDGQECNGANLANHLFWDGWFVEGDLHMAALARLHFKMNRFTRNREISVLPVYVTRDNIHALLKDHGIQEVDLFSLDIDGMDWWIWKELHEIQPRIVVVEYNACFGPDRSLTVAYRDTFDRLAAHPSGLYYGASLSALIHLGKEKGYRFVGCDSSGINAFFVRNDLAAEALPALTAGQGFRHNKRQNRHLPFERQYEAIRHLELVEI
ncbi:MAG: hypothetical protein KJ645_01230 [Planctomycetes bacterium]|nr:hypothetical protein [Planctomycetota bacterium]